MTRFGRGDYYVHSNDGTSTALVHARIEFGIAVDEAVPSCREALELRLLELGVRARRVLVCQVITQWAQTVNLIDPWLIDHLIVSEGWGGRRAAECWAAHMAEAGRVPVEINRTELLSTPFEFRYDPSDLSYETLDDVGHRMLELFSEELVRYKADNHRRARALGWKRTPEFRGRNLAPLRDLLEDQEVSRDVARLAEFAVEDRANCWLARFQCAGEKQVAIQRAPYALPGLPDKIAEQIAANRAYRVRDESTVADAIHERSKLLGLTLRTRGRPGRPRQRS